MNKPEIPEQKSEEKAKEKSEEKSKEKSKEQKSEEFYTINEKYEIISRIGSGGFSKVYLSEDQTTKKKYAIKVINEATSEFKKEVSILEKVSSSNNPYIINLIKYGESQIKKNSKEESQYIILEYASKGELFDYIEEADNGLEEEYAKIIFRKILEGVQAIHKSDICHRDLKMENILLDEFFNPKISDFGLATELQGKDGSRKLTGLVGTPGYYAPEMIKGESYDGIKVDIFCLGIILFNINTGKKGFFNAYYPDPLYNYIIDKNFNKYWDKMKFHIGEKTKEFKDLYIKMIEYNPEKRISSIDEILKHPWMKEINDLEKNNNEEYEKLEKKVYEKFKELDVKVKNKNEAMNTNNNFNINTGIGENKDLSDDLEVEYFNLDLTPKYILKTDLYMKHYIKINGEFNPAGFMNALANKIKNNYGDKCQIKENEKKLKFNAIFETSEEIEIEGWGELENLKEEKNDDIIFERKECIIQIKLFEYLNGGYVVRFDKIQGEIEYFHKNMNNIKKIIKNML